ncbi:MAG: membrane protein insertion efficiency factor YidD [Candidatus Obscuribacterales bacterium]|nr:membrane protein insertion efficiency factor YidD [Candidatus Obscuribacterales bacterium]
MSSFEVFSQSLLKLPSYALLATIRLYQKTRFLRPPSCRFYPSCSEYMAVAVQRFGIFHGSLFGLARLCRCHPFHEGGVDEVPESPWNFLRFPNLKPIPVQNQSSRGSQ